MDEGITLDRISEWSDDQLLAKEKSDFADLLYDRALNIAADLYDPSAYRLVELDPKVYVDNIIFYLRRRAWAEWYFGTVTPARQISLLPDESVDLRMRLARQISDEIRHHDVFSTEVVRKGGRTALTEFQAPRGLLKMHSAQFHTGSAAELAAANQYSGEIVLSVQSRMEKNILRYLVDDYVFGAITDIETDEPAHIAIGRDLVMQHSQNVQQRRQLAEAQERFLIALVQQHAAEIETLGAERTRTLPGFRT